VVAQELNRVLHTTAQNFLPTQRLLAKINQRGLRPPPFGEQKWTTTNPPPTIPTHWSMERLQEQMDALVKQRQHLETLEFTEAVEIQHAAVEEQISFLRGLAKEIQHG
jgi:hypothetical protein